MKKTRIILFFIFFLSLFLRLYGLDWDQGQHLHPDERFLTMVLTSMKIPKSISGYLNPKVSTMSPYNVGYGFFVYGTFPLNLTKIIGEISGNNNYGNIHFVGRILSAFFDIGVVFLLFKIGQKIFNEKIGLLAAFLYSIMVLPIQLSHFFAVDTFLNFFLVLSFYLLILLINSLFLPQKSSSSTVLSSLSKDFPPPTSHFLPSATLGASFGLALACKISAFYFFPIIALGFFFTLIKNKKIPLFIVHCSLFIFFTYIFFRFNQPQAFADANFLNFHLNPQFVKNLQELKASSTNDPNTFFPPAIQWIGTKPIIFPLKNLVLWGLGLPLGLTCVFSVIFYIAKLGFGFIGNRKKIIKYLISQYLNILISFWVLFLFTYQGLQSVKTMRYFLPIYPFLALLSAQFIFHFFSWLKERISNRLFSISQYLSILISLTYPLSFMSIYTKPITRVTASEWIYQNIPQGSILSCDSWDDCLPVGLVGLSWNSFGYKYESLEPFAPDTPEKWTKLNNQLEKIDYLILSSNRFWGPIPRLPQKYPITSKFYNDLFAGKSNFQKIAEFTSYPCFPPGKFNLFCFNDDSSEEAFTVYDHPKVMIFKRK